MFAAMGTKIGQSTRALCLALVAGAALVAGCSGSDGAAGATGATGPQGPAGPTGPTGPAGPVLAFDITTTDTAFASITGVTGTDKPTVTFTLVDKVGRPLKGMPASAARFSVAKLVPGTGGGSAQWVSYINRVENPSTTIGWGTVAQRQATVEAATTTGGVYVDNGDGTYRYTFAKSLGEYTPANAQGPAVAFDGALTHRIGFEARPTGTFVDNNPTYTYVPATGSTTTLPARYDVVNTAECSACHDKLAFHGGGSRTDVQHCVTCHNPGTKDALSGNSVDMKVMIHKIHRGIDLPTVVAAGNTDPAQGKGYTIWGNANSLHNYNTIQYTQDQRNCTTCHRESDTSTPQASNWKNVANVEACGTCHDDVNFTTGAGHGGIITNNAECLTCHGPNSVLTINGKFIRTADAHVIPELEAAKAFKFEVVRIDTVSGTPACAANVKACVIPPGQTPRVTIKVSNPLTGTNYALTDAPFTNLMGTTAARLRVRIAYTTANYTNPGANAALTPTAGTPAQPIQIDFLTAGTVANADGTFTKAATVPMPAGLVGGSGTVFLEGRTIVNVAPTGQPAQMAEIGVTSSDPLYFAITDASAVARRAIVNVQKCNDCHKSLSFHGDNRNNQTELCATCHNPELATQQSGVAGLAGGRPWDFKYMIHGIHAGTYNHGGITFPDVYPGALNNCEGCHRPDTYYPVDPTTKFGTTIQWGTARNTPADDLAITPNVAACVTCHTDSIAKAHMEQNGGVVTPSVIKNAAGQTIAPAETCQVCHGAGASSDVKVMHDVAGFAFR